MPVNKRSVGRSAPNSSSKQSETLSGTINCPIVKHCVFPALPKLSPVTFLLLNITLCLTSTLVQYLNIYKTVWWLPNSSHSYAVEFHEIDYYLLAHILLMLCTPYAYLIILEFIPALFVSAILRSFIGLSIFGSWIYFMIKIVHQIQFIKSTSIYQLNQILLLYFPLFALFVYHHGRLSNLLSKFNNIFRQVNRRTKKSQFTILPYLHLYSTWFSFNLLNLIQQFIYKIPLKFFKFIFNLFSNLPCLSPSSFLFPTLYSSVSSQGSIESNDDRLLHCAYYTYEPNLKTLILMQHQCLGTTADRIREEVDLYRRDFNARFTNILMGVAHIVYYSCFLPVVCTLSVNIKYDIWWCFEHSLIIGLSIFLLRCYHLIPCDYLDLIHRNAIHLGCWENVNSRTGHTYNLLLWSSTNIYSCGIMVKHLRGIFRSIGINNAAEPGNTIHSRYYSIFYDPLRLSIGLLILSTLLVFYQLISLIWIYEWYKLIGLIVNGLFSMMNFYFYLRNFTLLRQIYYKNDPAYTNLNKLTNDNYTTTTTTTATTMSSNNHHNNPNVNNNDTCLSSISMITTNSSSTTTHQQSQCQPDKSSIQI